MTDYLQELEFGLFPTPKADRAEEVLALVQLAEVLGLDLVSIQDHPYQESYLDTWTLLSVLGARTTTIKLSPNVASLPLRPPVVLAKSAATLDLLTGGRVELGLGAGAFWDGIVAAGGPRRTPGEAVAALEEAIILMRGVWGAEKSVFFRGDHYTAQGLHAGPAPAHDIPIWIGSYKPKMLRLTGRLADGWVPSMGYADPPALPALIEVLDEAAIEAGRDPAAIKRIYNIFGNFGSGDGLLKGGVADWSEQLATLALELGMSTFILGTDDATTLRRFADEVVPTVKEVVDIERARRAATPDDVPAAVDIHEGSRTDDEPINPAGQHLVDIHDHLRSELDSIRQILEQVSTGHLTVGAARSSINTMTMRQNNWTLGAYCESYCRIVTGHHTLEDRSVFPHLREAQPDLAPVLDRLQSEHEVIHQLLDDFDRALVRLVTDDGIGRSGRDAIEAVRTSLDELADQLLTHLTYEELQLIEPLGRHGFG